MVINTMSVKPQSHRIVRFLDRTIGCDWAKVHRSAMFATNFSSDRIRRSISTCGRAITNDWRISMARAIVGNRVTSNTMYDQLLRPTTDRTINRGDRSYDQSLRPATDGAINRCILRPIVRSIVAPDGR